MRNDTRRSACLPSHFPSSLGTRAEDELERALAQPNQEPPINPNSSRMHGGSGLAIKHAIVIAVAMVAWGLVAGFLWPDMLTLYEESNETMEEALVSLYAMTPEERDQLERAADGYRNLYVGLIVVMFAGFTAAAALKKNDRLKHVLTIAILFWLVNGSQILFGTATLKSFALSIIMYAVLALIAAGLSFIFVRSSSDKQQSAAG